MWVLFYGKPKCACTGVHIRKRFLFYQPLSIVSQPVRQLPQKTIPENYFQFVSQLVSQIPWGHNREIITKCNDIEEAVFNIQQ